jgi:hypothetical protein
MFVHALRIIEAQFILQGSIAAPGRGDHHVVFLLALVQHNGEPQSH